MKLIFVILVVLVASPAFAINEWTQCGGTRVVGTTPAVVAGACIELRMDSNVSSDALFRVAATEAIICFDPDTSASAPVTATVMVQKCMDRTAAAGDNTCVDLLSSPLDGTQGSAETQNSCLRVRAGIYRAVITAPGGETALLTVEGEI